MGWRRAIVETAGSLAVTVPAAMGIPLVATLVPGEVGAEVVARLYRLWGRTMLRVARVRLEVEGAEHLQGARTRVVLFNHGSILDACVVTALMPPHGTAVAKKEVLGWPLVGWAMKRLGFVLIDRGDSPSARAALHEAAERMQRKRLSVFIAPEGTRTRTGRLQRFKRGAFHLALEAEAPVVPVVIENSFFIKRKGRFESRPGVIRVRVMPPIRPVWTAQTAGAVADAMQRQYRIWLGELSPSRSAVDTTPAEPPAPPPA